MSSVQRFILVLVFGGAAVAAAAAQPVQADATTLGFQANVQSRNIVRENQWFSFVLELTALGSEHFQGRLHVERVDRDGDRVEFVEPNVAVTAGGGLRRVWCYAVATRSRTGAPPTVRIADTEGNHVAEVDLPTFEIIGADTRLVVDVSDRAVNMLRRLDTGPTTYFSRQTGDSASYRSTCVASLAARDLPDRWIGLEAVDVLVWDDPDPSAVSDAQAAAIVDWVRNGGQLVLGAGANWGKLRDSRLSELLPFTTESVATETDRLEFFPKRFWSMDVPSTFAAPIAVVVARPHPAAQSWLNDRLPDGRTLSLVACRSFGSGRVLATAARLRDLMDRLPDDRFLHMLIEVHTFSEKFVQNEANKLSFSALARPPLFQDVVEPIEFRRQAGLLVLAAVAFVGAYILLATAASWVWLVRRQLTHTSWTVFAAFAVVASLVSVGAVGLTRGMAASLAVVSVVDAQAGDSAARATVFLGYRSPTRARIGLQFADGGFVRGLGTSGESGSQHYATPLRYSADVPTGGLSDVPVRATLKEFEGRWNGSLSGAISANLSVDRATGRVTPVSWVTSSLNEPLLGGYLLYIDPRLQDVDGVPQRLGGLVRSDRKLFGSDTPPPSVNVLVARVPALKPGEKVSRIGREEYERFDAAMSRWLAAERRAEDEPLLPTLWHAQNRDWAQSLSHVLLLTGAPLPSNWAALLLASTRDLYQHNLASSNDLDEPGTPLSTEGLPDLDVTHWLTRGEGVLLLIGEHAGPALPILDGQPYNPRRARGVTLYRVRVPIEYTGRPPAGGAAEGVGGSPP